MLTLVFFYLVLPFLIAAAVIRFIRKHGASTTPPEIRRLCELDPVAARSFRVVRMEGPAGDAGTGVVKIGDYETQEEAVDAAYLGRSRETGASRTAFYVLDDKGDVLEGV